MNSEIQIVADQDIPYLQGILEPYASVSYLKGDKIDREAIKSANILIIRTRTKCDKELLGNTSVRLILTATIGYDHIDLEYCQRNNIRVENAAGCNARGVLQWIGACLAQDSRTQGWSPSNKCLGVVGIGNVGSLVAQYAQMWGFEVLCCDPLRKNNAEDVEARSFVSLEKIYQQADIITFHVPQTLSGDYPTYHLLNSSACETIKPNILIINASRGVIIDTKALNAYANKFRYAIDTWEGEPKLDLELLSHSLLSTPHIAGYSIQGKANGTAIVVRKLAQIFNLPLKEWYPEDISPSCPKDISWDDMTVQIKSFYDIVKDTDSLKSRPQDFEALRNNYKYRPEFF